MRRALQVMILTFCLGFSRQADATTYQVTNTDDSGAGSFRDAIEQVNANPPGPHRIVFAIAAPGVQTIHLSGALPEITTTAAIDATTQPSYNQTPVIEISGDFSNLPIFLSAPNSSLKGFALNNFSDQCVFIAADICTVSACFIGTNAAGTAAIGNSSAGIYVTGKKAYIGSRIAAFRNVISANNTGITLDTSSAQDTVVGNYIGTDVTGTVKLFNQIGIHSRAPGVVIEGNLISGNIYDGIYTECGSGSLGPGDGTQIYRNFIGTERSGRTPLSNGGNGIKLGCDYSVVGGIGKGNVISGNSGHGIETEGGYSSYNEIRGNKIGVSSDGAPLGNAGAGIFLPFSHNNVIGGSITDGSGNLIGSNGSNGIVVYGLTATDNTIQGNAIGTSFNGADYLGNGDVAVRIVSDRATVGGLGGLGNIIAHNIAGGVWVDGVQCPIRANSIFGHDGIGINLDILTSQTPNDSLDGDEGANHLQNYPIIATVTQVGSQVRLQGHLSSVPSHIFAVDFYASHVCGSEGYGEGETWLGSTNVTTNGSGLGLFDVQYSLSLTGGGYIFTSTATDDAGSTSEFSPCAPLGITPTAVEPGSGVAFALGASTPSPASRTTSLPFTLPVPSRVSLRAYDVSGRLVAIIAEGDHSTGVHRGEWLLEGVPAGTYFCKLQAYANDGSGHRFQASRTVVVVR